MPEPTIGLEVHVELGTQTKMFCACPNDPDERHPNVNVCPVCLSHPGTLPVINLQAVEAVVALGFALGSSIAERSHFDRKSYFYPDLPKGYQISQYEEPLVTGGELVGVCITRVHLEEDTGRLVHSSDGSSTLVDFNRAGIPLMELVTEPDIKSAEQAVEFAREFQLILRYIGISRADMEKGQMRIEANVSLPTDGRMGTKVELKNINSFRAVHNAIVYELERQAKVLEEGERVIQETRGWSEEKGKTYSQRTKESAHDYRYFPEPDLPPLDMSELNLDSIRASVPELPEAKRERFRAEYGLGNDAVDLLVLDRDGAEFFEEAASELKSRTNKVSYEPLYNYLVGDLRGGFTLLPWASPTHLARLGNHHHGARFHGGRLHNVLGLEDILVRQRRVGILGTEPYGSAIQGSLSPRRSTDGARGCDVVVGHWACLTRRMDRARPVTPKAARSDRE